MRDFKAFEDALKGSEYIEMIRPDELAFTDMGSLQMTIGYNYEVIKGGEVPEHERMFEKPKRNLMKNSVQSQKYSMGLEGAKG